MKNLFCCILTICSFIYLSVPDSSGRLSISDEALINFFYESHPFNNPNGDIITLDQFSEQVRYERKDMDVNQDGVNEIIFIGSLSHLSFLVIYQQNAEQLTEIQYFVKNSFYQTDIQMKWEKPYLFVDILSRWGGSNLRVNEVTRNIVRCEKQVCDLIEFPYIVESVSWGLHTMSDELDFTETKYNINSDEINIMTYGMQTDVELEGTYMCDAEGNQGINGGYSASYKAIPIQNFTYQWENDKFVETWFFEQAGYEFLNHYTESTYLSNHLTYLLKHIAGENASPSEQLSLYYDFFDASEQERSKPFYLPCGQVKNEYTNWFPTNAITTSTKVNNENIYFTINSQCELVRWKEKDKEYINSFDDILIEERYTIDDCNIDSTYFQWMDITNSTTPELIIYSGITKSQMWIFDISNSFNLIHQTQGFPRDETLQGVQIQRRNGEIHLTSGLPFTSEACKTSIDCYNLEHPFIIEIWDETSQSFLVDS